MSSPRHYGFGGNAASICDGVYQNAVVELPLPTYDEVINGTIHLPAGNRRDGGYYKTEALLPSPPPLPPSSTHHNHNDDDDDSGGGGGGSRYIFTRPATQNGLPDDDHRQLYEHRTKSSKKRIIFAILGLVLIPICIITVIIQLKVCSVVSSRDNQQSADYSIKSPYKLVDEYKAALKKKEAQVTSLRRQLKAMSEEKVRLEWLLSHADKLPSNFTTQSLLDKPIHLAAAAAANSSSTSSDNSSAEPDDDTLDDRRIDNSPISTYDSLNDLIQGSSNYGLKTILQQVQDIMHLPTTNSSGDVTK